MRGGVPAAAARTRSWLAASADGSREEPSDLHRCCCVEIGSGFLGICTHDSLFLSSLDCRMRWVQAQHHSCVLELQLNE